MIPPLISWHGRPPSAMVPRMGIANAQNLARGVPVLPRPYGIRVRLRTGDPFAKLLGGLYEPAAGTVTWDGVEEEVTFLR